VLTGMAGLVGGACSMALGEWLSVTNAHELAESQVDLKVADRRSADAAPRKVVAFGDAGSAAALSFFLFALGAMVPLLPFCLLPSRYATFGSVAVSLMALFGIGIATTLFAVGACAAAVTYLAGRMFGVLSR
jgi:VIT1/CCC1 family predicted Fe2+/Mn2+ transporter